MKYLKKLNFDNWDNISNNEQIKKLHPDFYQFLKKEKIMDFYLKIFDKCHWKERGNTFEEIMKKSDKMFLLNPFDSTLNYQCVYKKNVEYYETILKFSSEFKKNFYDKYI
jgi:vacuolar-type H+-ATPase catalytic subunit A/Vma1